MNHETKKLGKSSRMQVNSCAVKYSSLFPRRVLHLPWNGSLYALHILTGCSRSRGTSQSEKTSLIDTRRTLSSLYLRRLAKRNFVYIRGESNLEGISRNVYRLLSVRRCRIQLEDKVLAKLQKTLHEIRRCTSTAIRPVSLSSFPSHPLFHDSFFFSIFTLFLPLSFPFPAPAQYHAMKFYTSGPPSTQRQQKQRANCSTSTFLLISTCVDLTRPRDSLLLPPPITFSFPLSNRFIPCSRSTPDSPCSTTQLLRNSAIVSAHGQTNTRRGDKFRGERSENTVEILPFLPSFSSRFFQRVRFSTMLLRCTEHDNKIGCEKDFNPSNFSHGFVVSATALMHPRVGWSSPFFLAQRVNEERNKEHCTFPVTFYTFKSVEQFSRIAQRIPIVLTRPTLERN